MTKAPVNTTRRTIQNIFCWSLLVSLGISSGSFVEASSYGHETVPMHSPPPPLQDRSNVQDNTPQPMMKVPMMKPEHVALSLQWTSELNHRLKEGSQVEDPELVVTTLESHHIPPLTVERVEPTTLFHATKTPDFNLQELTQTVLDWIDLPGELQSLVLSLAMIYLDRASSVETPRSSGVPPCPFCYSSTVHRLLLSSTLIAAGVASGRPVTLSDEQLEELQVTAMELEEMMAWMEAALGDMGYFVSVLEMQRFKAMWERVFSESLSESPIGEEQQPSGRVPDHDEIQASHPAGFYETTNESESTPTWKTGDGVQEYAAGGGASQEPLGFRALPAFTRVHAG